MKRVILPILIAMTLLTALAGGALPFLLSPEKPEQIHHIPLQRLDYGDEIGAKPLTIYEKLCLLQRGGQRISVSPDIMDHSPDEIIRGLLKTLDRFSDSGILSEDLHDTDISAFPCMIFSIDTGEQFSKYWNVFLDQYSNENNYQITCLVDDDTMNLITVSCEFFNSYMISEDLENSVQTFAELYFRNLGIEDVEPYEGFEGTNTWYYQIPVEGMGKIIVEFLYYEYDTGSQFQITMIDVMAE